MSRFEDYGGCDEYDELRGYGWQANARRALKGRRGRMALRALREALVALPEKRLIDSAMCTVGDVDRRFPRLPDSASKYAQVDREVQREVYSDRVQRDGAGVCAVGAYVWHQKVKAGADPAEAFDALPALLSEEPHCPTCSCTAAVKACAHCPHPYTAHRIDTKAMRCDTHTGAKCTPCPCPGFEEATDA